MSDAFAKLIAIQAAGRKVQADKARSNAPPVMVGVPAGEVGGSGGGFSTPVGGSRGGDGSMMDEDDGVEDMYDDYGGEIKAEVKFTSGGGDTEDPVALVFPTIDKEDKEDNDKWKWSVCGGLIGGVKGGNRFCIKPLESGGYGHCGIGSHAVKKAELVEGFGYIPSNGDRLNTRSAFLAPTIDTRSLPLAYLESLQALLTPSQWVSFFAVLPTESEMASEGEDHQEIAAAILTKASRAVSFAYTPATKRPRLLDLVSRSVGGGINLGSRFKTEGSADKADLFVEELKATFSEGWIEDEGVDPSSGSFTPSISQWNLLIGKVGSLAQELEAARAALTQLADGSDRHLEGLDDQVTDLRASVGRRPSILNPSVPSMELWMSVTGLSQTLQEVKEAVYHPTPSRFDVATRSIAETAARDAKGASEKTVDLQRSKASLQGDHKPLHSIVDGIVNDLYLPSGMYTHLLNTSVGGTPEHPSVNVQENMERIKAEVLRELRSIQDRAGGSAVDPEDPTISLMNSTLRKIEDSLTTIKASLGGEVVRFDSATFHSASDVEVWLTQNMGADGCVPDCFYDIVSMLEALQDSSKTSDDLLGSQAGSIKAGHKGLSTSRMLNSFSVTIPQVLAKKGNGSEISAASYDKWKSNDGRTGVVEIIRKSMESWKYRTEGVLNGRFSTSRRLKILMLTRKMMNDSVNFWVTLVVWVDDFYNRLINQSERAGPGSEASVADRKEYDATILESKKEAWHLIIKVLTDIFAELNIRRADGQAAQGETSSISQCATVLYSALKAHKFMAELLERGFEKHPVMAPTFNGFLFSERASHGDVKRLDLKIGDLSSLLKGLQGKVDKKNKTP